MRRGVRLALAVLLLLGLAATVLVIFAPVSRVLVLVAAGGFGAVAPVRIAAGLYYQCFFGFLVAFPFWLWFWPLLVAEWRKK